MADIRQDIGSLRRELDSKLGPIIADLQLSGLDRDRIFRVIWRTVCKRAAVPGLLFHDLRRTGRRKMSLAGIPDDTALKIGGWKTDSVAKR